MSTLKQFIDNKLMRKEVEGAIIAYLSQMAVKDVFEGKDISGYKEAKNAVESAFRFLDVEFTPKTKNEIDTSI